MLKDPEARRQYWNEYRRRRTEKFNSLGLNNHGKPKIRMQKNPRPLRKDDKSEADLDAIAAEWLCVQDREKDNGFD